MIDISSNERTTWVNQGAACVARYCPISGEVLLKDGLCVETVPEEAWVEWKKRVRSRLGIEVPDSEKPPWVE